MLIVFVILPLLTSPGFASPSGKTGVAAAGCTCHGSGPDDMGVTLTAGKTAVQIGEIVNLTLLVEHAGAEVSGLDIAAKGGAFEAGSNTRVSSDEITHSEPGDLSSGSITYDFTWSSDEGGSFKLYGAALGGNGDGEKTGDDWAFAESVTIDVGDADTDVDADTDTDADTGTGTDTADTGGTGTDPCGCATGEGALGLVPVAAVIAGLRRRSGRGRVN